MAVDEAAARIKVEELPRSEGAEGTCGSFHGFKVQEAGPPQAVDTEEEDRFTQPLALGFPRSRTATTGLP